MSTMEDPKRQPHRHLLKPNLQLKQSSVLLTLKILAMRTLDILLPNWRDYYHPQNYLIPPNFPEELGRSQNPKGILESLKMKFLETMQPGDQGNEFRQTPIFEPLQAVIAENIKPPFIAFYNLDLNHTRNHLSPLFPGLGWNEIPLIFREYDFILIGPRIGIIIIEIKGSNFTKKKHFQAGNRFLPEDYRIGISRLESTSTLLKFLQECTGIACEDGCVRKVFFTPNLERVRYHTWMNTIENDTKSTVKNILGDIIQWYKEDMVNSPHDKDKHPLYTIIRRLLEDSNQYQMSPSLFESYVAILAAFASVTVKKSGTEKKILLDEKKLAGTNGNQDMLRTLETLVISDADVPPLKRFKRDPEEAETLDRSVTPQTASTSGIQSTDVVKNEPKFEFLGLAGQKFSSFQEQARFFLDTYSPNWCNYYDPISYIIPPVFNYRNPDQGDVELEHRRKETAFNRSLIDRRGDETEAIVYTALCQLIHERVFAPFLALQGLNLDKVKDWLNMVFPHMELAYVDEYKELMREFDFVLIGPNIGFVVIEVKSSEFTRRGDFSSGNARLPDQINHGLKQLSSIHQLIAILEKGGGIKIPSDYVRKVLFLANLEKERFERWLASLDTKAAQSVIDLTLASTMWWKNDVNDGKVAGKPPLYWTLHDLLKDRSNLPNVVYETCGPILAGLISVAIHHRGDRISVYHDALKLEQGAAALEISSRIESQDPSNIKSRPSRLWKKPDLAVAEHLSKVIFLTPEQQKALAGPNRQIIVGAAGTGKTIVLQEKALAILKRGESVLILAPNSYMHIYKELFESHGFLNYKVRSWRETVHLSIGLHGKKPHTEIAEEVERICQVLKNYHKLADFYDWLYHCDHVLVDDALDEESSEDFSNWKSILATIHAMLVFTKSTNPSKIVWIAMDVLRPEPFDFESVFGRLPIDWSEYQKAISSMLNRTDSCIISEHGVEIIQLTRVVRCTENIFEAVFDTRRWWPNRKYSEMPVMGHKIIGCNSIKETLSSSYRGAREQLWLETKRHLAMLLEQGVNNIAIIVQSWQPSEGILIVNDDDIKSFILEQSLLLSRETGNTYQQKFSNVYTWCSVSSLEWPNVIHLACLPESLSNASRFTYQRYRACTRATAGLIEVKALYPFEKPQANSSRQHSSETNVVKGIDTSKQYLEVRTKDQAAEINEETIQEAQTHNGDQIGSIMNFVGPTQTRFNSFIEMAIDSLNSYCPNWNNSKSYIFPPTFSFSYPDKSDQDMDEMKIALKRMTQEHAPHNYLSSVERPIIERRGDLGEFVVFQALWKLVQENVQGPFFAVHSLQLDLQKFEGYLEQIFPHVKNDLQRKFKNMIREYDFVLIGPKIGMVVIEVKSSCFMKKKDFDPRNRNLPDAIVDAIKQLNSFDVEFLRECTGTDQANVVPLRKFLFTPNLEKNRQQNWYSNLDQVTREKVDKLYNGITHWYKDNMDNLGLDIMKPDLYSSVRRMLESDGFQLPVEVYHSYGPLIVGLASACFLKSTHQSLELDKGRFSMNAAILRDAAALESQDPGQCLHAHPSQKRLSRKTDVNENSILRNGSKMILLTPEQRQALNGGSFQFIIGAPGTGKTVVLQAKALQMLSEGKRVLIFVANNFRERYRKLLFQDHGFRNYDIRCVSEWRRLIISGTRLSELSDQNRRKNAFKGFHTSDKHSLPNTTFDVDEWFGRMASSETALSEKLYSMQQYATEMVELRDLLTAFDSIFVDDACDEHGWSAYGRLIDLMPWLFLFVRAKSLYPSKTIWVAFDPYLPQEEPVIFHKRMLKQIIQGDEQDYFSRAVLQRVMRSSESVFQSTYSLEILRNMALKPTVGNKIHGFSEHTNIIQRDFHGDDEFKFLWRRTKRALDELVGNGVQYCHIAVIIGGYKYERLMDNFLFKIKDAGFPATEARLNESKGDENVLVVDMWNAVSSLEWPVVIYVELTQWGDKTEEVYHRYRACSRAIVKIFLIIAYENIPEHAHEADVCRGDSGHYGMGLFQQMTKNDLRIQNISEPVDQLVLFTDPMERGNATETFWKKTKRRCFSVHNLDLSTILVENETFKKERMRLRKHKNRKDQVDVNIYFKADAEDHLIGYQKALEVKRDQVQFEAMKIRFNIVNPHDKAMANPDEGNRKNMLKNLLETELEYLQVYKRWLNSEINSTKKAIDTAQFLKKNHQGNRQELIVSCPDPKLMCG